jgi:hypothetical protein
VFDGYTLAINPKALGLPIAARLRIRPVPGQLQKVAEILQGLPEIVECDRITGEDCFIALGPYAIGRGSGEADRSGDPLRDDQLVDHSVLPGQEAAAGDPAERPALNLA